MAQKIVDCKGLIIRRPTKKSSNYICYKINAFHTGLAIEELKDLKISQLVHFQEPVFANSKMVAICRTLKSVNYISK